MTHLEMTCSCLCREPQTCVSPVAHLVYLNPITEYSPSQIFGVTR